LIRAPAVLVAGALVLAPAALVPAHSLLLESSPAANAVAVAPGQVTLRFNNRIEKGLSRIRILGPGGARLLAPGRPDGPADQLAVTLPPLPRGEYRVEWQVLSTDGHVVSGSFAFRVAP
jgi:hypothetical protein